VGVGFVQHRFAEENAPRGVALDFKHTWGRTVGRMATFTDAEFEYLRTQPLGRIATVGANGRPHVTPVGVLYDPDAEAVVIGGAGDMARSKKFRDARDQPDVGGPTVRPWPSERGRAFPSSLRGSASCLGGS
jgi:Pyridoxamine 5'-phosphate oxidase